MGSAWMACRTSGLLQNAHISLQQAFTCASSPGESIPWECHLCMCGQQSSRPQAIRSRQLDTYCTECANSSGKRRPSPAVQAGRGVAQLLAKQVHEAGDKPLAHPAPQRPLPVAGQRRAQLLLASVGVVPVVAALQHVVQINARDCAEASSVGGSAASGWQRVGVGFCGWARDTGKGCNASLRRQRRSPSSG